MRYYNRVLVREIHRAVDTVLPTALVVVYLHLYISAWIFRFFLSSDFSPLSHNDDLLGFCLKENFFWLICHGIILQVMGLNLKPDLG